MSSTSGSPVHALIDSQYFSPERLYHSVRAWLSTGYKRMVVVAESYLHFFFVLKAKLLKAQIWVVRV